jgi:F-type H+-transporting ATPase subunit alpha
VGGAAQIKGMKQVAGTLKLDLAQFRDLEAFAAFASDLDAASQRQLSRGRKLVEILKQPQYSPYKVEEQIVLIYAAVKGYIDGVTDTDVGRYEREFIEFLSQKYSDVQKSIISEKKITDATETKLVEAIKEFNAVFRPTNA